MISMQIKAKIRNISKKRNIDFNTTLRLYMYDRFIERLAISEYKDNFILKGGFYLSTLFGIENRTTMDIDTALTEVSFNEENIKKIIKEIISIDIGDNVKIKLISTSIIKKTDECVGYRATITVMLENIKETFHIDIITDNAVSFGITKYEYFPILNEKSIQLLACNLETVLAEKIETILSRAEANSRMRDYYDIYLIYKMSFDKIKQNNFIKATKVTFKKREYSGDITNTLYMIENSEILKNKWNLYAKKNSYAKTVSYEDVICCLKILIDIIKKQGN